VPPVFNPMLGPTAAHRLVGVRSRDPHMNVYWPSEKHSHLPGTSLSSVSALAPSARSIQKQIIDYLAGVVPQDVAHAGAVRVDVGDYPLVAVICRQSLASAALLRGDLKTSRRFRANTPQIIAGAEQTGPLGMAV
jgi:hypothetical protein